MQLSEFWKIFIKTTEYGGAIVSFVLNSVLILLILFRSPPNLGTYKYLMLYIVLFQITYSVLDILAEPTILSYGPAVFVFRNYKNSILGREDSFLLIVIFCGGFGISIAISAIHFIYRYGAVDKKFRDKYLSGNKLVVLFLAPVFNGAVWTVICVYYFHYDGSTDLFARDVLLEAYDTHVDDISYMIVLFYRLDKRNNPHADPNIFFAMSCVWSLLMCCVFCMFFYGIKCYQQLTRALANTRMASTVAKSLQHQLLLALVIQTLIPVILMYIPAAILYMFPIINMNVGLLGSFVTVTIAIYPAIDPLPTMFIVKSFRDTLLCRTCGSMQETDHQSEMKPRADNSSVVLAPSVQIQLQRVNIH